MQYVYLMAAIVCEVGGTLCLRAAATGRPRWYAVVAAGYAAAFVLLLLALRQGMPLGVAYGVWAATGVALTAVASRFLFSAPPATDWCSDRHAARLAAAAARGATLPGSRHPLTIRPERRRRRSHLACVPRALQAWAVDPGN